MKYFYVYKTTNLLNSKFYIGKHTSNKENDEYFGSGKLLCLAINKYGIENFKKEILEYCCSNEELNEREKFWIEKENSLFPIGYNIAKGGDGGDLLSNHPDNVAIRKDISIRNKLRFELETDEEKTIRISKLKGLERTSLTKTKISEARTGMVFSEEHRANISKACIEYMKVIPRYNQKKINCYTEEGIFIKEVESIAQAAREFGQNNREICNMCKEKSFKIKDYIFKYSDGTTDNIQPIEKIPRKKIEYKQRMCLHCSKTGRGQGMTKYHFDNCKHKDT